MKKLLIIALVITLFGAPQQNISADELIEDGRWYFTPMGTYVFREDKARFSNTGPGMHFGFARGVATNWAVEVNLFGNQLRGDNQHDIGQYGVGLDLIHAFDTGSDWSPYALLGTGYMKTRSAENGNLNPVGVDSDNAIGSAAIGIARSIGDTSGMFRTELRYRADFADQETYGDLLFNIGFTVPLARPKPHLSFLTATTTASWTLATCVLVLRQTPTSMPTVVNSTATTTASKIAVTSVSDQSGCSG